MPDSSVQGRTNGGLADLVMKAMQAKLVGIPRKIADFHLDEDGEWIAELECGHQQQIRHSPPWTINPWITTPQGRLEHLDRDWPCSDCYVAQQAETDRT